MQKKQAEEVPLAFSRAHSIPPMMVSPEPSKLYSEGTDAPADNGPAPRVPLVRNLARGFHTLSLRFQVKKPRELIVSEVISTSIYGIGLEPLRQFRLRLPQGRR